MHMYQYTAFVPHDALVIWNGFLWTLGIFGSSMALGSLIGFVLALVLHARVPVLAQLVIAFVELFRNSPLLVQLFLVFYGLPMVTAFSPSAAEAAIVTMTVNTAAFMVIIVVSALDAVPRGQWQAAGSSGMSYAQVMRLVVLPQAIRTVIPPTIVLAIGQLQTSSLVSIIGVDDLARAGTILNTRTLRPFIIWPVIGLIYFLMAKVLSHYAARIERRVRAKITWFAPAA
jgi:His/Glu/Gln/Arg/opine family amino acid ABC transporter permease subunit